jgi:hypothetical protein
VGETIVQECPDLRVVINAKDVKGALLLELGPGATARSIVDLDGAVVALRHVIYGRHIHIKTGFVDS